MGLGPSVQKIPVCHGHNYKKGKDEFDLSIDSGAFDRYVTGKTKALRVSKLKLDGTWEQDEEPYYSERNPYRDDFIVITPLTRKKTSLELQGPNVTFSPIGTSATVEVLGSGVNLLYHSHGHKTKKILCTDGASSVLYYNMILRKKKLEQGQLYSDIEENIILLTPDNILVVTLPYDQTAKGLETDNISTFNNNAALAYLAFAQPHHRS